MYKNLGETLGESITGGSKETGQIENILAAIDQVVNGEVNLPAGEHPKLFERIREVGAGYTIVGTRWTYNEKNEISTRDNLIRMEDYEYVYDTDGNLLTDGRSKYKWNARGQLMKVTFPDGFGESYTYDMFGRRMTKSQFNHEGSIQETTEYHYKGDTYVITDEKDASGETVVAYTFSDTGRPLSITYNGETFWYVYNGHGDVTALTDKYGKIAARYEYDAWGLVTRMYNRFGQRVREGIGWMGDLGTGNGSPGSKQGPEDESGNTEPDYHPGIGNAPAATVPTDSADTTAPLDWLEGESLTDVKETLTEDITTELVKINPYRYAGYYWDRKTQMYHLQARYYDPRNGRFISADSYRGEEEQPLSQNLFVYALNNPVNYVDPTGHMSWWQVDDLAMGMISSLGSIKDLFSWSTLDTLWDTIKAIFKKKISLKQLAKEAIGSVVEPFAYLIKNTKYVWKGDPSNKEVKRYGKELGNVLQMVAGSSGALKIMGKIIPGLKKLAAKLPKKKQKKTSKGCNCFTAGTKVLTDEGEKNIEDIKVGDKVLSKDEITGKEAYKEVTATFNHETDEIYRIHVGDQIIESTFNHPFWVDGKGWTFVKDLKIGDLLVQSDGNTLR